MNQIIRDRVSDQVHRYLRDKIIDGEFIEGKRLVELDIAAELGVSRTPVREALWQLKSMDLIRSVGASGYEVTNVKQELLNILDIRAALEAHAVRRAAGVIGRDQLARIAQLCDNMEQLPFEASDKRAKLNRRFHEELIRASGNERLLRLVSDYQEYFSVAQPLFDKKFIVGTQCEHRAILDALNERDGDKAAELIIRHILGAAKFLQTGPAIPAPPKMTG
jgi:DNA-binding GntR family transcriptional regulator